MVCMETETSIFIKDVLFKSIETLAENHRQFNEKYIPLCTYTYEDVIENLEMLYYYCPSCILSQETTQQNFINNMKFIYGEQKIINEFIDTELFYKFNINIVIEEKEKIQNKYEVVIDVLSCCNLYNSNNLIYINNYIKNNELIQKFNRKNFEIFDCSNIVKLTEKTMYRPHSIYIKIYLKLIITDNEREICNYFISLFFVHYKDAVANYIVDMIDILIDKYSNIQEDIIYDFYKFIYNTFCENRRTKNDHDYHNILINLGDKLLSYAKFNAAKNRFNSKMESWEN